jgi:hypothetical protein
VDELNRLARLEHQRWCEHQQETGWSYGPVHDASRKHHPDLVPFEGLSSAEQAKDRDAIVNIPTVLAAAGLHVEREQGNR